MTVAIQMRDVRIAYQSKPVLSDVNLDVPDRRITAFIGPSGCGKTSLLSCLNRLTDLMPGCSVGGRITVHGRDLFDPTWDLISLRRSIGMIFQKPNPFPLSIQRNMELPLIESGVTNKKDVQDTIEKALMDVGLWEEVKDRLTAPALALSGGQQQRLCIARALVLKPKILLLDEPCSALDPLSSAVVEDLMTQLRDHYTIVVVTHNLSQAKRIADKVAFFWVENGVGRLIEAGATVAVFHRPTQSLTHAYVNGARG